MRQDPCHGSFKSPVEIQHGIGKCRFCKRWIRLQGEVLYRHVPTVDPNSRRYQRMKLIGNIERAMEWQPSGSLLILVRLWFRDYGGTAAFNEFSNQSVGSLREVAVEDSASHP